MQPTSAGTASWSERHLGNLRDHRIAGVPVRFYLRRQEQVHYLMVGAWNTVFGYAVWAALQLLLGDYVHYLVIVLIAWPLAVLNAYVGYRHLVFRSRGSIIRELPRFAMVYVVTLVINLALLPVALTVLPFDIYVTQALLLAVVVVGSYLSHKYVSFGGQGRSAGSVSAPARGLEGDGVKRA